MLKIQSSLHTPTGQTHDGPAQKVRQAARLRGRRRAAAAPVPAGGPQLAALLVGPRHRHHPRRRDGSGQDHPDHHLSVLALQRGPLQGPVSGQCPALDHHQLGARIRAVGPRFLRHHLYR